jgi:hypothetical protein
MAIGINFILSGQMVYFKPYFKYMTKLLLISLLVCISFLPAWTQNINDDCENAMDITSELFTYNEFRMCTSMLGTIHAGWGAKEDRFEKATVDGLHYNSDYCNGYTSTTTDAYPDLWYKINNHNEGNALQQVYLTFSDTIQIAVYFGRCEQLYQSQCFTLTPLDSSLFMGFQIEFVPHEISDAMYIQVKMPQHENSNFKMCFSDIAMSDTYFFQYGRPALTKESSEMIYGKPGWTRFTVSPGLARDDIILRSSEQVIDYEILDITGNVQLTGLEKGYKINQPIENIPGGFFILKARTEHGVAIRRFWHGHDW